MEQASALWTYIIGVAWNSHRSGVPYALNRHPFANGICGQGTPELMGMDAMHIEALSNFAKPQLYGAYS